MYYNDLLATLFRKQKELMELIGIKEWKVDIACDDVDLNLIEGHAYAIMKEAVEMKDEFPWEWWQWKRQKKLDKGVDIEKVKEELIDIQFFVLGAALLLKMTPIEFFKIYEEKSNKNIQRLKEAMIVSEQQKTTSTAATTENSSKPSTTE